MGLKTEITLAYLKTKHFLKGRPIFFNDHKEFKGKKVIIVGPATSSLNYLPGSEIDKFDIIVRINNATILVDQYPEKIGSRTDILFHCMTPCTHHGFKSIEYERLKKQGTKYVLYSYARRKTLRRFYQVAEMYPCLPIFRTDSKLWFDVLNDYTAKFPTTGLLALVFLMRLPLKELHVTGFTFYQTNYVDNYTDDSSCKAAVECFRGLTSHNPDEDLAKFMKEYKKALGQGKKIILDQELAKIVQEYKWDN